MLLQESPADKTMLKGLAELLDMEVEVLMMAVVVGVRHLDERDAGLEQPAGQQTVPAELVAAPEAGVELWPHKTADRATIDSTSRTTRKRNRRNWRVRRFVEAMDPRVSPYPTKMISLLDSLWRSCDTNC